jgi:hypothetical protein
MFLDVRIFLVWLLLCTQAASSRAAPPADAGSSAKTEAIAVHVDNMFHSSCFFLVGSNSPHVSSCSGGCMLNGYRVSVEAAHLSKPSDSTHARGIWNRETPLVICSRFRAAGMVRGIRLCCILCQATGGGAPAAQPMDVESEAVEARLLRREFISASQPVSRRASWSSKVADSNIKLSWSSLRRKFRRLDFDAHVSDLWLASTFWTTS